MNDLRINDLFDLEPLESRLRSLTRPWRMETLQEAPQIKLDVKEQDDRYTVRAEIPGVRKEDIDLQVDGNRVSISAEVKREKEEKQGTRVLRSERSYGYAHRSFVLPAVLDEGKTEAKYENGVLELTLPKRGNGGTKRVAVS